MYGKIFASIYDGTLRADWKALVTFQQFIVLSDAHGSVDMTAHAIHGRTGIPLDIIEPGIKALESPDPASRSDDNDGRRIVLIDPARVWGWRIVNYAYYRNLASADEKREKDRARLARKRRGVSQPVASSRESSPEVVNVAEAEAEAEAEALNKQTRASADALAGFKSFWIAYPRKKSKGKAEIAWKKFRPDEQLQAQMLSALERAKTSADWVKEGGRFIPYPATWLNAKGWEDGDESSNNQFRGGV